MPAVQIHGAQRPAGEQRLCRDESPTPGYTRQSIEAEGAVRIRVEPTDGCWPVRLWAKGPVRVKARGAVWRTPPQDRGRKAWVLTGTSGSLSPGGDV